MAGKSTALLGIYPTYSGAISAVNVLKVAGFRKTEMRIGALTIPGLGPFAAADLAWSALAVSGDREGGAGCGIADPLIGMGISEHEAKHYELRVEEGGILLWVHSDNSGWTKRAMDILERTGAEDISGPWHRTSKTSWPSIHFMV
ncbi:MAG: hypothetical protein EHM61_17775 [Acidobacteria bacterium]|nr:MAG: hypothetical protein EHM61_17775 [Acidobacteriota bacterium]